MDWLVSCCRNRSQPSHPFRKSNEQLAKETHFSVDEVYALQELFSDLSNSLHKDDLIHKDEFALSIFKTSSRSSNILIDKMFQGFDTKKNDVIDFEEFVSALSVFHPRASLAEKALFAFSVLDLDNTNTIEKDEVKRSIACVLEEDPNLRLRSDEVDDIIERTFQEADLAGDGRISYEEWQHLVAANPSVISFMTIKPLESITLTHSNFVWNKDRKY